MPTPAERKALVFLAGLLVLGTGARVQRSAAHSAPPSEAAQAALARQIARVDAVRAAAGTTTHRARGVVVRSSNGVAALPVTRKRSPPTVRRRSVGGVSTRITTIGVPVVGAALVDLDRASAADIERLPGIGPVLAKRIVLDRQAHGPFGSLQGLERVKGIGRATAKRLAPHVTFSLPPRPSGVDSRARPPRPHWRRSRTPGPGSGYP
jgi:competence protein ComEA